MVTTRTGPKQGLQKESTFIQGCLNGKYSLKGVNTQMLNNAISMVQHQLAQVQKEANTDWSKVQDTLDELIAHRYLLCKEEGGGEVV